MERKQLYLYAIIFIALAVLLVIAISNYYTMRSMNDQLNVYKKQQREFANIVTAQYLGDMSAARQGWIAANQKDYIALQNQGISVEADSLQTQDFTVVFDLNDPSLTRIDMLSGDVAPGEVVVYLGQYFRDDNNNFTRVPGWIASYTVNTTTHAVSGLTAVLIGNIAYQYYVDDLSPTIYLQLGVSNGTVVGTVPRTIDCSYDVGSGTWMDVSEYRYSLKNNNLAPYLLIKTYVNATDERVKSFDISKPYYTSVTGNDF